MDNLEDLVVVLENSEDATALKEQAMVVETLASTEGNCKRLFETEGLIGGLVRVMGKDGEGFREAREKAVLAIGWIAYYGSYEVKKGLLEYDGLVDCLLGRMREGGGVGEGLCCVGNREHR